MTNAKDSEHDSDSDILEPYSCMECDNKFEEQEEFRDDMKEAYDWLYN